MLSKGVIRTAAIAVAGVPLVWAEGAMTPPKPPVFIAQARPRAPVIPATAAAPAPRVQFEVASVRLAAAPSFMDRFTMDPGRVEISSVSVQRLMEYAFRLPQKQVDGPAWIHHWGGQRFDISAKLPQGTTPDQIPEMLRALLVDRFKLVYHMEHREEDVEALVVGKGALKLDQLSPPAPASALDAGVTASMQTVNGLLTRLDTPTDRRAGSQSNSRIDGYTKTHPLQDIVHYDFSGTLQGFADLMVEELQRPVVDMTGLEKRYHVVLDVRTVQRDPAAPRTHTLAELEDEATEYGNHVNSELQKLGLRLETRKAPVEYVVADRVEQTPTDN